MTGGRSAVSARSSTLRRRASQRPGLAPRQPAINTQWSGAFRMVRSSRFLMAVGFLALGGIGAAGATHAPRLTRSRFWSRGPATSHRRAGGRRRAVQIAHSAGAVQDLFVGVRASPLSRYRRPRHRLQHSWIAGLRPRSSGGGRRAPELRGRNMAPPGPTSTELISEIGVARGRSAISMAPARSAVSSR